MARNAVDLNQVEYPHGTCPDKQFLTVGADDITPYEGRGCVVTVTNVGTGSKVIEYVTVMGSDVRETIGENGTTLTVGLREVEVRTIKGSSTITQIAIGPL